MDFSNLNISEFLRYVLTGFNFLLFVVGLPLLYLQPNMMKDVLSDTSFLVVSLLGVSIGYLMDMLKVYQFTPNFNKRKLLFRTKIAEILDIPLNQVASYFSLISKLWGKYTPYSLERRRAEWILILHTAVIFAISIVGWSAIIVYELIKSGFMLRSITPIFAIVLSIFFLIRLLKIANREREKSDQDIIIILRKNKARILEGWNLALYEDDENAD